MRSRSDTESAEHADSPKPKEGDEQQQAEGEQEGTAAPKNSNGKGSIGARVSSIFASLKKSVSNSAKKGGKDLTESEVKVRMIGLDSQY